MSDKVQKLVLEVWGGDDPLETKFGPMHYVTVRFLEDDGSTSIGSVGCKAPNLQRVRDALHGLIEVPAEFKLQLKDNGNYKILDYPGKKDSECRILGERPATPAGPSNMPATPPVASASDRAWQQRMEDKVDAIIELISIKDVLFSGATVTEDDAPDE